MKSVYKFLLILSAIAVFGCKKSFLDVPDKTSIIRQDYVKDLTSLGDYMNGIYILLGTDFYHAYNIIYGDLVADDIKLSSSTSGFLSKQYTWSQAQDEVQATAPTNNPPNMNPLWTAGYKVIRACSFVIEVADKYAAENTSKAQDIKGQAYALRALVHHHLVNVFAQPYRYSQAGAHPGIPYITTSDLEQPVTRQTVSEVYAALISDLSNAVSLLPLSVSNKSKMNAHAAKALLARVYLYKGDYQNAKKLAREVSAAVPIMVGANYPSKLFTNLETEALFQLPPSATTAGGTYNTNFAGRYFVNPKRFIATSDIALLLNQNPLDVRKAWTTQSGTIWNITKYPSNVIAGFSPTANAYYQTLLRSSEMYLTAAEAYNKLNNDDSARYFLDQIRLRGYAAASPSSATGTALLDSILLERRKELCFEGFRMYDLLRTGRGVNRTDTYFATAQTLPFPSDKAIAPIPALEVLLSKIPQNSGY